MSLAEAKNGNAQLFSLHGTMINDAKQRPRVSQPTVPLSVCEPILGDFAEYTHHQVMEDHAYTAWNADVGNYMGHVPGRLFFPYKRTQLQGIPPEKKTETPVRLNIRAVKSQTEEGLRQETDVVIDVYTGSTLLGEIRGAEGVEGAVVVDRGAKDGGMYRKDTDIVSSDPLVFTLRYQPHHLNCN